MMDVETCHLIFGKARTKIYAYAKPLEKNRYWYTLSMAPSFTDLNLHIQCTVADSFWTIADRNWPWYWSCIFSWCLCRPLVSSPCTLIYHEPHTYRYTMHKAHVHAHPWQGKSPRFCHCHKIWQPAVKL